MIEASKYTIGWVCAIPCELAAARMHLDPEHPSEGYINEIEDTNSYAFGKIGEHNVVIAALPAGQYGISKATSVAENMIRSFTNIRICLMVGVAGGAPLVKRSGKTNQHDRLDTNGGGSAVWSAIWDMIRSLAIIIFAFLVGRGYGSRPVMQESKMKQDIRLGDVIVGIPGNGRGGVWQYDFGKAIQGKGFVQTGHLNAPPQSILTVLTHIQAEIKIHGHSINQDVEDQLGDFPRALEEFQRPPSASDRLYKASFVHPKGSEDCSETCTRDDMIVKRPIRDVNQDPVRIFYGLIASADQLMKNAVTRDDLARREGVLCFEMEAAGLMGRSQFLVIRGVCDYSDSHKNKEWQGYAAMTAAAYAKKLLLRLTPAEVEYETKLSELTASLQHVEMQTDHIVSQIDRQNVSALRREIERWLAAPDPSLNHNVAVSLCHEGSGMWVLQSDAYQRWSASDFSLLWLHGITGCGKTILASSIIRHISEASTGQVLLMYFYFDVREARMQKMDDMLRALLRQMCYMRTVCQNQSAELYSSCQNGKLQPTTTQLKQCLASMCEDEAVIIVLDALDECSDRDDLMVWLKETSQLEHNSLIVTSRPEYDIKMSLMEWIHSDAEVEIRGDSLDADIRAYIKHKLRSDNGFDRWRDDQDLMDNIESSLMNNANGMYRWVVCQLDAVKNCFDLPRLKKALQELPKGRNRLIETYDRIVEQIPEDHTFAAIRLLQFLMYSERPLKLAEATDILAVNLENESYFDPNDRMKMPLEIAKLCGSLTRLVSRNAIPGTDGSRQVFEVQLAHPSVLEYLSRNTLQAKFQEHLEASRAKAAIVQVSIAYLRQACIYRQQEEGEALLPFTQLAARLWIDHAPIAEKEGETVLRWIRMVLLSDRLTKFWLDNWLGSYDSGKTSQARRELASSRATSKLIYITALGELEETRKSLLNHIDPQGRPRGVSVMIIPQNRTNQDYTMLLAPEAKYSTEFNGGGGGGQFGVTTFQRTQVMKVTLSADSAVYVRTNNESGGIILASIVGQIQLLEILGDRGCNLHAVIDSRSNTSVFVRYGEDRESLSLSRSYLSCHRHINQAAIAAHMSVHDSDVTDILCYYFFPSDDEGEALDSEDLFEFPDRPGRVGTYWQGIGEEHSS